MANAIPPPAQRLINCLANISPRTQSRGLKITSLALFIILLGALITSGLGFAGKLPEKLETPLLGLFSSLMCFFGTLLLILCIYERYLLSPRPQPILFRAPSEDSGVGSASPSLALSLDRSRENLYDSRDSGFNVI